MRKGFCQAIYRITNHDLNLTRAIMGHTNVAIAQKYSFVDETEIQNAGGGAFENNGSIASTG